MIETEIALTVNRKSDIDLIEQKLIGNKIDCPIYIREYEFSYQINFTSDHEHWSLDNEILNSFPGYEFKSDLQRGRKEIRLQVCRYQSELCTDDWGRQIENPLNEVKYLVKTSFDKPEKFTPKIKVLFGEKEQFYFINIVNGVNKVTEEKGFLLLDNFRSENQEEASNIFKDKLYKSPLEAFNYGYYKMANTVQSDFKSYLENKKKEIREKQKHPRKIIRDFVSACNSFEVVEISKNLDSQLIYEKRLNQQRR